MTPRKSKDMTQEIKGRECLKIRKTSFVRDYRADSKLAGQQYAIFSFGDKAFAVNTADPFIKSYEEGDVYSVEFGVSDEGLSLLNFTTLAQEVRMAKAERTLEEIKNFKPSAVALEDTIA